MTRPRRRLVARLDNEGDVLLAGPAVRAVAASGGHLTLLCGPRGAQAAALLPGVDDVLVHRAAWIDPDPEPVDPAAIDAFVAELRARRIDEAIVLTSFHQSALPLALLLRLAGVGTVAAISDDYPGSLLDVRHRIEGEPHEAERALAVVGTLGHRLPPGDRGELRVRLDAAAEDEPAVGGPYVVVHPGASVPARAWEPGRNRELVAALADRGHQVVVTGAPGETGLTAHVAGAEGIDLGGRTSFAGLARVLEGARAVVVGNTGPAHLAAAVGTPVVSLFAPTVPTAWWRPWAVPHELLYVDVPCAGCRARTCPVPGHPCLSGVRVADVVAAVERLADQPRSTSNQTRVEKPSRPEAASAPRSTPQRAASRSTIPSP
jgi:ADP-heptose:LPS heptosyltransferase